MTNGIRFDNGETYERYMGQWSQLVGEQFLDWLAVPPGQDWLDVGCGNGAFTDLLMRRCAPAGVAGIDPSEGQLRFARTRPALQAVRLELADAMGPGVVSMSFGAGEGSWTTSVDAAFSTAGMSYLAATGDSGSR